MKSKHNRRSLHNVTLLIIYIIFTTQIKVARDGEISVEKIAAIMMTSGNLAPERRSI